MKKKTETTQYDRMKGAEWFPHVYREDVMVLGQGGIGSWTSLLLGRLGCNLHIYDMDSYEGHNLTGQAVGKSAIGLSKTEGMKMVLSEMSPDCKVYTNGAYDDHSETNHIVICGFDNMEARKTAFKKWNEYRKMIIEDCGPEGSKERLKEMFFQDGRLLAEQLQIFNLPGERTDLIEKYEKEHLFSDEEVAEADCTFKQTSHCAAMIAAHMVGFFTNWITNVYSDDPVRHVPFSYEYYIPINLVQCLR